MSPAEILSRLRDVQEPLPPEASVPWLLLGNVFVALSIAGVLLFRRWQSRRAWRQQALASIETARTGRTSDARTALAITLRKVMLHIEGPQINTLSGESWLQRLDRRFETDWFSNEGAMVFGDALYTPGDLTQEQLTAICNRVSELLRSLPVQATQRASDDGSAASAVS